MDRYEFVSVWQIPAPLPAVWETIRANHEWPEWWRGVLSVQELAPGDEEGVGAVHRSVWKSALPYKLQFDSQVEKIDKLSRIELRAFGELDGKGVWQFSDEGLSTRLRYDWTVFTTKRWMNVLAPVARPLFRWNHDVIMRWGEEGLKTRLGNTRAVPGL